MNGFNPHVHSESISTLGQSTDQMNHLNSVNSNAHLTRWMMMVETYPTAKGVGEAKFWWRRGPVMLGIHENIFSPSYFNPKFNGHIPT